MTAVNTTRNEQTDGWAGPRPTTVYQRGEAQMKDIDQVLKQKWIELLDCKQKIACLRIVAPLLAEESDKPPEVLAEEKRQAEKQKIGWP